MPCTSPLKAYALKDRAFRGGKSISFLEPKGLDYDIVNLPCGKCADCRLKSSRDWSIRLQHESQMHDACCFLTLTYDDDHIPRSPSGLPTLRYEHVQTFFKDLRAYFDYEYKKLKKKGSKCKKVKISYYYCGEYGEETLRPHYHVILFGWFPPCSERLVFNQDDNAVFSSPFLEERFWRYGIVSVQNVNFAACKYVAGYVNKKRKDLSDEDLALLYGDRVRERAFSSTRPAIGKRWFDRYKFDVFPSDSCVVDGFEFPVPRYYLKLLEQECNKKLLKGFEKERIFSLYECVKKNRLENLVERSDMQLHARDRITKSKLLLFKRNRI